VVDPVVVVAALVALDDAQVTLAPIAMLLEQVAPGGHVLHHPLSGDVGLAAVAGHEIAVASLTVWSVPQAGVQVWPASTVGVPTPLSVQCGPA